MGFNKWLETLVEEKELDLFHNFEVTSEGGTWNLIPLASVVEYCQGLDPEGQAQVKKTLVQIDFRNGDVMDFFRYIAQFMANSMDQVTKDW